MNKFWISALLFVALLMGTKIAVNAGFSDEQILLETQNETKVYKDMDVESTVVEILVKGTPIICAPTEDGEWYEIMYKEITGYVQASDLGIYEAAKEADKELEEIQEETEQIYEDAYEVQRQRKSDFIWIGVMAVLIFMMFATGIYTVVRNNKKDVSNKE